MTATLEQIGKHALSSLETIKASYDLAVNAIERGIPGDFVECGVYAGANAAAMALAIMECGEVLTRRLHLFDSFEGIPQAGEYDQEYLEAGHEPGLSSCSYDRVRANMARWGIDPQILIYWRGWFDQTIPFAIRETALSRRIARIAALRLDGDLYESTKICMEQLYPLVSPGGWIMVDDFGLTGCRKAVSELVGGFPPIYFQRRQP